MPKTTIAVHSAPATRRSIHAPVHVRIAVQAILTGHMAGHLTPQRVDLTHRIAARNALEIAGFGEPSITNLLDRAIELARFIEEDRADA